MINPERLVATFIHLVTIDSPSGSEQNIALHVADHFRALGLSPSVDALSNVSLSVPGKGKPLFLNAHLDNVSPAQGVKPVVIAGRITSDGTTVLGADDLAGVAAIMEAVQSLVEDRTSHLPLDIAITTQEEVGLVGAKGLDLTWVKAKEGVVLDAHGPVGGITLASPTHNRLHVAVKGRAAHSAVEPEAGVNALQVTSVALSKIKLGRVDKETTSNFGTITGGTAMNIVPDRVELLGEVRSRNGRKLDRTTRAIKQAFEKAARARGAQVEFEVQRGFNRYVLRKGDPLVKRVAQALGRIGRKPRYELSMGGSDANIWNAKGIKCVVVSVGYEQIHSTTEFIPVEELVKAAQLVHTLAVT